jgi:hypothetical protein
MSYRSPDNLDDELSGLFARATSSVAPRADLVERVERLSSGSGGPDHTGGRRRGPAIAATLSAVLVVALLAGVLVTLRNRSATGAQQTGAALSVSSVTLTVSPNSIDGAVCDSSATFTYTAVFHIPANTAGGSIKFNYTLNNGRSQTPGSVTVPAGATTATYTFTSSGALLADHTYPGPAQVTVTSPNSARSNPALPGGSCAVSGPFQVDSVDMVVSPASVAGLSCGMQATVTYTATFHLAADGPGGTIQFFYTTNNGRGDNPASINVAAGQTTATYQFTWSGTLPPDHTAPQGGGVIVSSPNSVTSQLVGPSGQCS